MAGDIKHRSLLRIAAATDVHVALLALCLLAALLAVRLLVHHGAAELEDDAHVALRLLAARLAARLVVYRGATGLEDDVWDQ